MKVLILGVGNAQVDAINYLKSTGHEVVGIAYRSEGNGIPLVDEFALIDITDKAAVLKFARGGAFDLVYSVGSDVAMPTISFVSEELGLPCYFNEDTANLLQDKYRFREFLTKHDLNPIYAQRLKTMSDAQGWQHFPAIIKPVDSQGQRGIFEVSCHGDIVSYFPECIAASRRGEAIIEAYIEGPELSVNTFFKNGSLYFLCISSRSIVEGYPGGIASGHHTPVDMPPKLQQDIIDLIVRLAKKLNIKDGPLYLQIKYQGSIPYFIEVSPRLDGCHLWKLIERSTGVNLLAMVFNSLLNAGDFELPARPRSDGWKLTFAFSPPGEVFVKSNFLEKDGSVEVVHYYGDGDIVQEINGHQEKVSYQLSRI